MPLLDGMPSMMYSGSESLEVAVRHYIFDAQEVNKPRPICVFVIVGCDVEAHLSATALHVLPEGLS